MLLEETERYEYVIITEDYQTQCHQIVSEGFSWEPSCVFMESDQNKRFIWFDKFVNYFSKECCSNGLSIMCREKSSGNIAGVLYVRDFKLPLPEDFTTENLGVIPKTLSVLEVVDHQYDNLRPNLEIGQCVDLWMLAVDSNYRRQGIADKLTSLGCQHVKNSGFSYVILEASGGYSAKCAESAGMTKVVSVKYEDIDPIFIGMPEIHSHFTLWEKVL